MDITDHFPHSSPYESTPISQGSRCTRVLDVEAEDAASEDGGIIKTNLRVINLDVQIDFGSQKDEFLALSYAWGSPNNGTFDISCGESILEVRFNCHSALRHVRRHYGRFTVWIDAICINQDDQRDKENQIPLMGDIYSKASPVIVWLGEGSDKTDRAMSYLSKAGLTEIFLWSLSHHDPEVFRADPLVFRKRAFLSALWAYDRARYYPASKMFPRPYKGPTRLKKPSRPQYASYDYLNALLDKDWISRMWTYQEIIFASTPVVICGNKILDWTRFATSLLFLDITGVANLGDDRQIYNIRTWTSLILSRDYFLNIKTAGAAMNEMSPQPNITTPTPPFKPHSEASEIQKYLIFHKQMLRLKILRHKILTFIMACIMACIFAGSIFSCAFLIYESVDRKKFHKKVETLASSIVASVFNHSMTDNSLMSGRQSSDTGFNSARQTSHSTTSLAAITPTGISSSLQVSTTSSVDARLTSYRQALATVAENCYSSCTSYSILTRYFQSCTASQSGKIPRPTEALFYQAGEVTGKVFEQFFSWIPIVLIPIVSSASDLFELLFLATISLLTFAWMPYLLRRKLASGKTEIGKLEAIELEVQINLLDVLYNRRASKNEDRNFALWGIVKLLAAAKLRCTLYTTLFNLIDDFALEHKVNVLYSIYVRYIEYSVTKGIKTACFFSYTFRVYNGAFLGQG